MQQHSCENPPQCIWMLKQTHDVELLLSFTGISPTKLSFKYLFCVYLFMWLCIRAKFGKATAFKSKPIERHTYFLWLIIALYSLHSK